MAITQNTYTGNGSTVLFSFTFPYLETTDIKVSVNGTVTTAYTLANATTIQFNTAPANGAAIRIYRQTDDAALAATFYPGSAIRSNDLNDNFTQNLYVTQESSNNASTANTTANTALTNSNTAISTANSAVSTANTASSNASSAVATANTASSNASAAVSTANTASTNATTAVNTANTALSTANAATTTANAASSSAASAVSTANTASTNATTAVSTANSAQTAASSAVSTANSASTAATNAVNTANSASSTASGAVTTANTANSKADQAIAAVSSSINYTLVTNVAGIPASPANDTYVEVGNSTGIESFTPLAGMPAGFVGDSGLSVRMRYTTAGATWNWQNYYPNNAETRYLKLSGGTLSGNVTAPALIPSGGTAPSLGLYTPSAGSVAISSSGVGRLFVDASGNVCLKKEPTNPNFSKSLTVVATDAAIALRANSSGTYADQGIFFAVDGTNYSQIYNISDGQLVFRTGSSLSERLRITSSGLVGVGTSAPTAPLDVAETSGTALRLRRITSGNTIDINFHNPIVAAGDIARIRVDGDGLANEFGALSFWTTRAPGSLSERLRIDSLGRVGIGTTSAAQTLECRGTTRISADEYGRVDITPTTGDGGTAVIRQSTTSPRNGGDLAIQVDSAVQGGNLLFRTGGSTERARLTSSGQLLVGTSSTSASLSILAQGRSGSATEQAVIRLCRGSSPGTEDVLGAIGFGDPGHASNYNAASLILSARDSGTWTAGTSQPSRLVFSTSSDNSASPSERVRISSTGAIGLSGANYGTSGQVLTSSGSGAAPTWKPAGASIGLAIALG